MYKINLAESDIKAIQEKIPFGKKFALYDSLLSVINAIDDIPIKNRQEEKRLDNLKNFVITIMEKIHSDI